MPARKRLLPAYCLGLPPTLPYQFRSTPMPCRMQQNRHRLIHRLQLHKLHISARTHYLLDVRGNTLSAGGAEISLGRLSTIDSITTDDCRSNHCWEESIRRYAALWEFVADPFKFIGSFCSHVPEDDIECRELRYDLFISTERIILCLQRGDTSLQLRYYRGHGWNSPWQPISRKHYFSWGQIGKCHAGKEENRNIIKPVVKSLSKM
ncbi:hypothetical protein FB451DRAFT_1434367 [Mycena latifolia]|nr:hypothetical protein FB451DRAFT_1434367 [Mycena latifolia]